MFWPVLLFILGICLIVLEFVLPGVISGIAGVVLLCVSAGLAMAAYPEYTVWIVMGEFFGVAVGIGVGLLVLSKTSRLTGLTLETSLSQETGYVNLASNTALVGKRGTVMTILRPAGTIVVDGVRYDAVSDGDFIDEGSTVTVLEVHGNRVVVERATH